VGKDNGKGKANNPGGNPAWYKGMPSPNPGGKHNDKIFGEALRLALKREFKHEGEQKTYLAAIVVELIGLALKGNMSAIQEIANRMDGRPVNYSEGTQDITTHAGEPAEETQAERDARDATWIANLIVTAAEKEKTKAQKRKMN
tara:strand:- start:1252 stop:1683 length:432 start_codon:yes stop_codon:yes gene_type:complete